MKARLTTVLSLSGVLVAGSAAALVNTQVLQSRTTDSGSAASETITTDTLATDTTLVVDTTLAPDTTLATPIAAPVSTQAIYQIGDAGSVTLDTAGDVLTIVAATPNPGWTLVEAESDGPLNVEVKFQSSTMKIEFKANLLFGVVSTSVESEAIGSDDDQGDDDQTTTPPNGSTYDDDDDDDEGEHDDDDHDDEHDDDDDDEHDDD